MWELDCEESWMLKNWCFWTVLLEKTLESPLDCTEIQPVHSEGDQPWVFFGRNDARAETPVLWPPHAKNWLIGKDSDAGRYWGQEEKGMTEDKMAEWHHRLHGREFEWTPGVCDGQGGLACCNSWDHKESDTIKRLNWTKLNWHYNSLQFSAEVALMGERKASLKIFNFVQALCRVPSHDQRRACSSSLSQEDPSSKPLTQDACTHHRKLQAFSTQEGSWGFMERLIWNETFPV